MQFALLITDPTIAPSLSLIRGVVGASRCRRHQPQISVASSVIFEGAILFSHTTTRAKGVDSIPWEAVMLCQERGVIKG